MDDETETGVDRAELTRLQQKVAALEGLVLESMSLISHELKSPLVSVGGFATTMLVQWESMAEPDKLRYLGIISAQAQRLARLIDDLVVLSKADAGVLHPAPLSITAIGAIRQCLLHSGKGDEFEVVCDEELEVLVDAGQLQHMLGNCVVNAVAHGAAPFRLQAVALDGEIEFRVLDSGEGIPPEFIPQLFEQFTRGPTAPQIRGSGVGLAAARCLAEVNGGRVSYAPNTPTGSVFSVTLPAAG